jgi:hypothetical protein
MSGRRHRIDSIGNSYEDHVAALIGRMASLVKVPREQDYGVDFFCLPRVPAGATTETVSELSSLQVKGGQAKLVYGGLDDRGNWREYEFAWLRSLATPLHLARVDSEFRSVELFSIWPLWWIFWRQSVPPFEVVFSVESPLAEYSDWQEPKPTRSSQGAGKGDGTTWAINLGPPFLQLTNDNLNDSDFREQAVAILRERITTDRLMLMLFHLFIPTLTNITAWSTKPPKTLGARTWQFWDARPGVNIERLCQTASPILVNLGIHLQWQNDAAAYHLVPVLEWLNEKGWLDGIGKGLLDGLHRTQARGEGPKESSSG